MAQDLRADTPWLIADIGATSTRCATCCASNRRIDGLKIFQNDEFASLDALLGNYLSSAGTKPSAGVLAIASPIGGDDIEMTNRNWRFNRLELGGRLGLEPLVIINDFHAVAFSLPNLSPRNLAEIGKASAYRDGNRATLGPGSGLGVGGWISQGGKGIAMVGEGGHVTLPGRDDAEDRIISKIRERYGHASAERVLSGPGIIALHSAMHGEEMKTSLEITRGTVDRKCRATMEQFYRFLASVASDLALTTGAYGGVYIAGGIVPDNIEQIKASTFRERFEDKNRYRAYMQAIPTYVITDPTPGLTGLVAYVAGYAKS